MRQVLAAFARNTIFANIVFLLILLAGGIAASLMVREDMPQVSLDEITISVAYPGADPEEVEEGVSRKVEEALDGMGGVKRYTTQSSEGLSMTELQVKEGYDASEVLDRVRSAVDSISAFPVDAERPILIEKMEQEALMGIYLSGDMSERRLKEWAERVKDDLQQFCKVSRTDVFGVREYEIGIEVSEERLREYGLTFAQVTDAIRRSNMNLMGGTIRAQGEEIRIRTVGRKYNAEKISSIVVMARPQGDIITLARLATIRDGFTEDPIATTVNGVPSVLLTVYKASAQDALVISNAVRALVKQRQLEFPGGTSIEILYDNSDALRSRVEMLMKNGAMGLCLVFLLLWIFLDARLSFWVGMGVPVSIAGALFILWSIGGTFNMISFFGLILVLGIIVDDAIVVGEAIFLHRKRGESPIGAAVEGVYEVGMPVTAAVTTTILAFIPLAYVRGTMGNFIAILPPVVIACLAISLIECLILLPAHLSHLPDPNKSSKAPNLPARGVAAVHRMASQGVEWFVEHIYSPFLGKIMRWRYASFCAAVCILLLTLGLVQGGILKFEPLPDFDGFIINSSVEFPDGTPLETTEEAVRRIEAALLGLAEQTKTQSGDPLLIARLAVVGQSVGGGHHNMSDMGNAVPHQGGVQAILLDSEKRGIHTRDIAVAWERKVGAIPGAKSLTFEGISAGPPGAPIEVWLQGHDMDPILSAADDLMQRLRRFEGVYQVSSDSASGKNEARLELKPEARALGLTVDDLAGQVSAGYYGAEAVRLQRGRDDVRVKVRYSADERSQISHLERVRIRTRDGHEIPMYSVADVGFAPGYSSITRTNGMRRIAVSAEVDGNIANANEIIEELSRDYFQQLELRYQGLRVTVQGEEEEMRESLGSLFAGFPIALLGIMLIIATTFRSYAQPLIIMVAVPFGIVGGILGHVLLGYDLSLMSVFGMVALTGVVVNDAIVLIERINKNLAEGLPFFEAIRLGGMRRFRPIFLTTISTVGALAPLIGEKSLQAQWLIPMAISLAAGVSFATVLTLLLIPSLLVILNDMRLLLHRIRYGNWPTREEVEPAHCRNENSGKYLLETGDTIT